MVKGYSSDKVSQHKKLATGKKPTPASPAVTKNFKKGGAAKKGGK